MLIRRRRRAGCSRTAVPNRRSSSLRPSSAVGVVGRERVVQRTVAPRRPLARSSGLGDRRAVEQPQRLGALHRSCQLPVAHDAGEIEQRSRHRGRRDAAPTSPRRRPSSKRVRWISMPGRDRSDPARAAVTSWMPRCWVAGPRAAAAERCDRTAVSPHAKDGRHRTAVWREERARRDRVDPSVHAVQRRRRRLVRRTLRSLSRARSAAAARRRRRCRPARAAIALT